MDLTNESITRLKKSIECNADNYKIMGLYDDLKNTLELFEDVVEQLRNSQTIMISLAGDDRLPNQRKENGRVIKAYVGEDNIREMIAKLTQ